jgi:molybdate transport system permease protein
VPLQVQIAKNFPDFALDVSFASGDAPLSILGSSGAGKSMLLRCIAGLDRPDRGTIILNGRTLLNSEKGTHVPARERRVGMLFQHYALFPHRTLAENVAFGIPNFSPAEKSSRVTALLHRAHIGGLGDRYPREVSGGEQQRAALARALAIEPEALLLDEPLSALDTHLRSQIEAQLQETFAAFPRPALVVTHNIDEAYRLSEQLLVLSKGKVAAFGAKDEVFRSPPTLEVARLTGCKNFSRARLLSGNTFEALDWNCTLQVSRTIRPGVAHVGIRAHHIEFTDPLMPAGSAKTNVFPCWLVRASEAPFRVTLFLSLHRPIGSSAPHSLQVEVSRENWPLFCDKPLPWHIHLAPDSLFLMPD